VSALIVMVMTLLVAASPAAAKPAPPKVEALLKAPSAASVQPSPPEVDAYRESFGVSKAEATERLKLQTKGAAGHIGEALEAKLGEHYGGLWFDNQAGQYVVALVSPGSARAAERSAVATELGAASLDSGDYRTTTVDSSWSDLLDVGDRLGEELKSLIERRTARVAVKPSANAVIVGVRKGASASALAEIARLANGAGVEVKVESGEQRPFDKEFLTCQDGGSWEKTCSQPMRGGVGIRDAGHGTEREHFCTSAFRARGKSDGKHYFLTAGHCVKELNEYEEEKWEDVVWDWETWDPVTWTGQSIGTLTQWYFPHHDWAKIDVTNTWADASPWNSVAYWNRGFETVAGIAEEEYFIYGEAEGVEGAQACHSGIATGTSCGHITKLEKAFNPNEGPEGTIVDAWEVENTKAGDDLCVEEGDSGGSVFASHYALGIVSYGTPGDCDPASSMNFVKIKEATEDLNVSLTPAANAPAASTDSVTGYPAPHQATARGYLYGGGISANYHFDYGTSNGIGQPFAPYESSTSLASTGSAFEYKTGTLTGLKGGTTYHFRIVVQNSAETAKGVSKTFTTPGWKPLITPEAPTEVKAGHGELNAQINPQGTATSYRFEWGKASEGFPNSVPVPDAGIGSGTSNVAVHQEITGLKGLTEYHWRVVASNEEGTTTSATQTFTTPDWRPVVTTEQQSSIRVEEEEGRATLHGKVNPKGFATTYHFEWGTEEEFEAEEYGHSTAEGEAGSGEEDVSVEATAKGLKGKTTYHFRLVAENVEGQSPNPQDKSFTTPDWRPLVAHSAAVGVGAEDATLVSRINPEGFATAYHIEWADQAEYEAEEYGHEIEGGSIGSGQDAVEIEKQLEGLDPRRTYHFRVIAENAEGSRPPIHKAFSTSTAGWVVGGFPRTLQGTPEGTFVERFGGFTGYCTGPTFEAVIEEGGSEIYEGGDEILATDSVEGMSCNSGVGTHAWHMNGCQFEFDPGYGDRSSVQGELDIGPPGCGPITFDASYCPVSIPSQIGRSATYANEVEGQSESVRVDLHVTDLRYSSSGGWSCPAVENAANGELTGTWQVAPKTGNTHISSAFEVGPEVQTGAASDLTATTATLHSTVDTVGYHSWWGFEYGLTEEYGSVAYGGEIAAGVEGSQAEELELTDLIPGATYHYRAYGLSLNGFSNGEDATFTMSSSTVTGQATAIDGESAALHGTVDPGGYATAYRFEYGTSDSYGSYAPASPKGVGSGVEPVEVSESIEGLSPGQVYHYRLAATNEGGTTYGEDRSFKLHAPKFVPGGYPATISASQPEAVFSFDGKQISCPSSPWSAELNANAAELSVEAEYAEGKEECYSPIQGANGAKVAMNSCRYSLGVDEGEAPHTGAFGVECEEEGDAIKLTLGGSCNVTIPAQSAGGSVSYSDEEAGADRVRADLGEVQLQYTASSTCAFVGLYPGEDGEIGGPVTLRGSVG